MPTQKSIRVGKSFTLSDRLFETNRFVREGLFIGCKDLGCRSHRSESVTHLTVSWLSEWMSEQIMLLNPETGNACLSGNPIVLTKSFFIPPIGFRLCKESSPIGSGGE
jgi:hypothetical protein